MAAPIILAPRSNMTQQVNYIRRGLVFTATGPILIGSIPTLSVITAVALSLSVPFNGGTANNITLGITPGGAELMAAGDNTPAAAGYYTATRGLGNLLTLVSPGATAFGDPEGGVPIYLTYAPTGTAPTAGSAVLTLHFVPPSDT